MSTNLDAKLRSVGELFDAVDIHYEIPIYQRNYAWGVEQIEQLIDDVWAAVQADADNYFLGNLIVASAPIEGEKYIKTYEVVDGQQRLTTLFMLLAFLEVEPKAKLTYESRRSATDALSQLKESDDEDAAGIHTGFKAIESRMSQFSSGDDLEKFKKFLRDNVQLVRAILPAKTDLNKYFEIMNTRGQQLEQVDIVKARLMSYLAAERERVCFAWIWNACADMDSYMQMALTPRDPGLRSTIFGKDWDQLKIDTFEGLLGCERRGDSSSRGLEGNGAMSLQDAERRYARAAESPPAEDDENRRFESPIKFPSLLLHALKVLRESDLEDDADDGQLDDGKLIKLFEDEFKPPSGTEGSAQAKGFAETLLRCRFVLDNFVIKREFTATNGEDGAWSLKRLVARQGGGASYPNAFRRGEDEWDDTDDTNDPTRQILLLQSMLRITYTSPRTMHWITAVLRIAPVALPLSKRADAIHTTLRDYARKKVRQALPADEPPIGFSIERVIFTYLDYLLAVEEGDRDFQFIFRNSIEHFYPQSPDDDLKRNYGELEDKTDRDLFGNLALLTVRGNSKFTNSPPFMKADNDRIVGQSPKLRRMAKIAKADPRAWNSASIKDHHQAMVQLLWTDLRRGGPSASAMGIPPILTVSYPGTSSRSPAAQDATEALRAVCQRTSEYVSQHWARSATDYEGASSSTHAPIYGLNYWEAWELEPEPDGSMKRWLDWWAVGDPAHPNSLGRSLFFLSGLCADDAAALALTDEDRRRADLLKEGVRMGDRVVRLQSIDDGQHRLAQVAQPEEVLVGPDLKAQSDSLGGWIVAGFRALTLPLEQLIPVVA